MAVYPNIITTNKGLDLISRSNTTGKGIEYTHVALGDGELGSKNIADLTDLISTKMSKLPVTNNINHGNGHYEIEAEVNNEKLNTGFWAREMGVFAKCEGDSDSAIVLFAYTNGGNYVPYVNDKSRPDIQLCQLDVIIGNATKLNALIDTSTYVTNARLTTVLKNYVPFTGGKMTGNLEVLNQLLTSNDFNAANTSFVQSLVQSYLTMGATNFVKFKQSVINTFEQDFSNPASWWIKLPSGLIIQGISGRTNADNNEEYFAFPIAFKQRPIMSNANINGNGSWANVVFGDVNNIGFKAHCWSEQSISFSDEFCAIAIGI